MFHLEGLRSGLEEARNRAPRQNLRKRQQESMTSQVKKRRFRVANLTSEVIERGPIGP
jgi:hypothetical protein